MQHYLSSDGIEPLDWAHIALRATKLQASPAEVLGLTAHSLNLGPRNSQSSSDMWLNNKKTPNKCHEEIFSTFVVH